MTAKTLSKRINDLQAFIDAKKERLRLMREMVESCSAFVPGDMPKNPSPSGSSLEQLICKIIDLENEIKMDEMKMLSLKSTLLEAISKIDNPQQQTILTMHLLGKKTLKQTSDAMFYSPRWVYDLYKIGLENLDTLLKENDEIKRCTSNI